MKRNNKKASIAIATASAAALSGLIPAVTCGQISLTTAGSPYTQNFDSLVYPSPFPNNNTTHTTTAIPLPNGWSFVDNNTTFRIDGGASNAGDTMLYGATGNTERAFGSLASGTSAPGGVGTGSQWYGANFINNTGDVLTSLNVAYEGEQWRDGGALTPVAQTIHFQYSLNATGVGDNAAAWVDVDALDMTTPVFTNTGAGVAVDGNVNFVNVSGSITGVTLTNSSSFFIRWRDINDAGNDHGMAVDDFSLTPIAPRNLIWNPGSTTWDHSTSNWLHNGNPVNFIDTVNPDVVTFTDTGVGPVNIPVTVSPTATIVSNTSGSYSFSGAAGIGGPGPLIKSGAGTLLLATDNTYSGGTQLNGGQLVVNGDSALGASAGTISFDGGMLSVTSSFAAGRNIILNAGGGTIQTGANNLSFVGTVTGSGGLTKSGTGNLELTGAVGTAAIPIPLTINAGNVILNSGSGAHVTAGGAINGNINIAGSAKRVNFTGGAANSATATYTGTGAINVQTSGQALSMSGSFIGQTANINLPVNLNSDSLGGPFTTNIGAASGGTANVLTINGLISGTSDVIFTADTGSAPSGSGIVVLNSANTWVGSSTVATVASGVVRLGVNQALPAGGVLGFGVSGSTAVGALDLNGKTLTVAGIASGTTGTINGIANTGAATTLTINGSTNNTYAGGIGIPANVTNLAGAHDSIALTLSSLNTGVQTLTGASTYSGGTTINGGTLRASNATGSATGTGPVVVNSTGTLGGTGRISGAVTVASGGTLAPGASVGTLTAGSLSLASGSLLAYEIDATSDATVVTGNNGFTANGGAFSFSSPGTPTPGFYTLIDYAGSIQGTGFGALTNSTPTVGTRTFDLRNNTGNTSVDLLVTRNDVALRKWQGSPGTVWSNGGGNFQSGTFTDGEQAFFDDTASGSGTLTISGTVNPGWTYFDNTTKTYSVSGGVIGGTDGLSKAGSGDVTITGSNTFTGPVSVRTGRLIIDSLADSGTASAIGQGTTIQLGAGGTLRYTGGTTLTNRPVTLDLGGGTIDITSGAAIVSASGQFSGSGSLTKAGAGELRLGSGASNYLGATTVSAGTLRNSAADVIPNTSALTVAGSATYNLDTFNETVGSIAGAGTITGSNAQLAAGGDNSTTTFSGSINGTGMALLKTGTGTLSLTGANGMTGALLLNGGTVAINSNNAIANVLNIGFTGVSTLRVTNSLTTDRNVNLTSFDGTISVDSGATASFTGSIPDGGTGQPRLTKAGPGTLVLSTVNATRNDPTTIDGGTIRLTAYDSNRLTALGDSAITINNGGTLELSDIEMGQAAPTDTRPGVTLFGGATLKGTGSTDHGNNSKGAVLQGDAIGVRIDPGTEVTVATVSASDNFVLNSTIRNTLAGTSAAKVIVDGPGRVQLASGGTSTNSDQFTGTWEARGGGILQIGPITDGGAGTPINGLGYSNGTGANNGPTRPITLKSSSTLLLAQVGGSGVAVDTMRSPITLDGGGLANRLYLSLLYGTFSGDITLASNSFINTNDPLDSSSAIVNIGTQMPTGGSPVVNGDLNWGNATLSINGAGIARFERNAPVNIGVDPSSAVAVTPGATVQINNTAALHLAGTQDALSDGTDHVDIINNSTTTYGLDVQSGVKNVGAISGSGSTTVTDSNATLVATSIRQNILALTGSAEVRHNATSSTSRVTNMTIGSGKTFDLNNNKLIVTSYPGGAGTYSGSYNGIAGLVRTGMNPLSGDPTWTGTDGIVTTETAAGWTSASLVTTLAVAPASAVRPGSQTFGGIDPADTDALVMYTYNGDANLSGNVDADDYFIIDSNYNDSGSVFGFYNGDFDYDGDIDGDDFARIDAGFVGQGSPFSPGAPVGGVTAVPEPTSLGVLGLAVAGLLRRRRRS